MDLLGNKIISVQPKIISNKIHKNNVSSSYHKRIQKKWDKRFGFRYEHSIPSGQVVFDKVRNIIYCRQEDVFAIEQMIREASK